MSRAVQHFDHLIVGGGMAAHAAVMGIRRGDARASVGIVCGEHTGPYRRPPLSKSLWSGGHDESLLELPPLPSVELLLGRRVARLDLAASATELSDGQRVTYGKLLLATGSRPRRLPIAGAEFIRTYRTLRDYRWLASLAERGGSVVLVGGGLISVELASALTDAGCDVSLVVRGAGPCEHLMPEALAARVADQLRVQGVALFTRSELRGVEPSGRRYRVQTTSGGCLEADGVVVGVGVDANDELAAAAGLRVDRGIVVDAGMRTSHPQVFAAGDVARVRLSGLGPCRPETEQHAQASGLVAGANMVGGAAVYDELPFQYSEFFGNSLEIVGRVGRSLRWRATATSSLEEGVWVYADAEGRACGALFWNMPAEQELVEELVSRQASVDQAVAALDDERLASGW